MIGVNKIYADHDGHGSNHVVKDLNLSVYEGEFLTLLGSSGCGKTTTLRMVAGFEEATSGTIHVEGESVGSKEPFERDVNTVFQSYALFPHMTVHDNVAYGLKMKKVKKPEIKKRVEEMLELVQLGGFEKRYPSQLSGGQKQRVAIARALINQPKVLLLDEPLGALDLKLRKQMQIELKRLQKKLNITFIYVTHDQEEALIMSDRIAIMDSGVLQQVGDPTDIYENPKTKFVATFIGETNLFEGSVAEVSGDAIGITVESGGFTVKGANFAAGELITVSVQPEKMLYSATPVPGFALQGLVKDQVYVGSILKTIVVLSDGQEVKIERLAGQELPKNGLVYLFWNDADAKLIRDMDSVVYEAAENVTL
ncbi:MAG: ABC transporter ATP-binding protein [Oscillospiraceae bacterium]|nr:ABC transporter ATP-binding protein [Oscillospiraceae bacterium]